VPRSSIGGNSGGAAGRTGGARTWGGRRGGIGMTGADCAGDSDSARGGVACGASSTGRGGSGCGVASLDSGAVASRGAGPSGSMMLTGGLGGGMSYFWLTPGSAALRWAADGLTVAATPSGRRSQIAVYFFTSSSNL
jgi:hypothetical protein